MDQDHCPQHVAHEQHFDRLDARVADLEDDNKEFRDMIARMDTIIKQLQKLYWAFITSIVGVIVTAVATVLATSQ